MLQRPRWDINAALWTLLANALAKRSSVVDTAHTL